MLFKYLFGFYLLHYLSAVVHEMFHLIVAIFLKVKIAGVVIGEKLFHISFGRLRISPLLFKNSFIDVEADSFETLNFVQTSFFYVSGSMGNLAIILLSACMITNPLFRLWLIIINGLGLSFSLLPVVPGNDGLMIYKAWCLKKNNPPRIGTLGA